MEKREKRVKDKLPLITEISGSVLRIQMAAHKY